jgi:hypothetical protein
MPYSIEWARQVMDNFWMPYYGRVHNMASKEIVVLYKKKDEFAWILAQNSPNAPKLWYEYKKAVKKYAR